MNSKVWEAGAARAVTVVSAWTAVGALVVLCPVAAFAGADQLVLRILVIIAILNLLTCAIAATRVAVTDGPLPGALLCMVGSAGALVSLGYLWSIRDVPTVIPLAGFGSLMLSLVLAATGSTLCAPLVSQP